MEETTRPDGGHGTLEQTAFTQVDQVEEAVPHGEEPNAAEWLPRPEAQGECDGDSHLSDTTTCSGDTYVMVEESGCGDTPLQSGGSGAAPHGAITAWPESNAEEGATLTGHETPDSCLLENLNPLLLTPGLGNGSHLIGVTDPLTPSTERAPPSPRSPVGSTPQVTNGRFIPSTNAPFLGPTSQQRLVPQVPDSVPSPSSSELPPSSPSPAIFTISGDDTSPLYWDEACVIEMRIRQKTELPNGAPFTEGGPPLAERCDSTLSSLSEKLDICRICHCEGEESNKLISPCLCSGSLKFIHLTCLQKWIKSSDKKSCELCNFDYIMTTKTRPFKQWEKLEMTAAERRKIVCSVTFHIIAITCVIWSLYVLIDRSTEEVHSGSLDWPFWTKLIVVAIGFTGGLVFMYVQCKMYIQLCFRWRQFNKLINIENAPEDPDLRAEAAARIKARSTEKAGVVNTVALTEVDSF